MTSPNDLIRTLPKNFKPEDIKFDDLRHMSKDSFPMWCLTSGVQMDHKPIDFDKRRYLLPIYADDGEHIVWQKAAQLGATSYMLLRALWWLLNHQGRKAGLYFPTKEGVENLSSDRVTPLIDSCPDIKAIAREGDKLGLRKIGTSSFYLYHLGGTASKDSVPLDFLTFDEVRLCSLNDIYQAMERISGSEYGNRILMSTCGHPDDTINLLYQGGTQHVWHSKCGCPDGCDLARAFPECLVADDPRSPTPYYRCPKCKYILRDPQNGRYVPMNPGGGYTSYHVSQLVGKNKTTTPAYIWNMFKTTTNMQEFYNSKLGLPYIDEQNIGVTRGMLTSAVDEGLEWRKPNTKREKTRTCMGIDQGGGYCYVVIADINPDGTKKRIRHLEIIESNNPNYYKEGKPVSPFVRCAELMTEFDVGLCVCDMMPNYNEALAFAKQFLGRVFLAWYQKDAKDAVAWNDRAKTKQPLMKAGTLKFKYTVALSRFNSMSFSLGEWKTGDVIIPPTHKLVQMCRDEKTNVLGPESPGERFFSMLPRLVKRFHVTNEDTGEGRWEWIFNGGDPHFAHAWNYCTVGLERLRRSAIFAFA